MPFKHCPNTRHDIQCAELPVNGESTFRPGYVNKMVREIVIDLIHRLSRFILHTRYNVQHVFRA